MGDCITRDQIEVNLAKIKRFASLELARLAESAVPFCYQAGPSTLIVGRYRVIKDGDESWTVESEYGVRKFYYRRSAILYCIALHTNDPMLANQIYRQDEQLNRLESDAVVFRYQYRAAKEKSDEWRLSLFSTRYHETMYKIESLKTEFEETKNLAKYLK